MHYAGKYLVTVGFNNGNINLVIYVRPENIKTDMKIKYICIYTEWNIKKKQLLFWNHSVDIIRRS